MRNTAISSIASIAATIKIDKGISVSMKKLSMSINIKMTVINSASPSFISHRPKHTYIILWGYWICALYK